MPKYRGWVTVCVYVDAEDEDQGSDVIWEALNAMSHPQITLIDIRDCDMREE